MRAASLGGPPPARLARWWPWARPPADTVLPRSEHHARTRSATGRRGLRQEATREEGGINRERAKGRTPPPRPRWGWGAHGRKPKHHPRPQQVQGPRGARSLGTEKAPCPERAGAAGGQGLPRHSRWHVRQGSPPVWRPGGTSRAPLAPGPRSRALRRARSPPGLPCPWGPGQGGQPPPPEKGAEPATVQRRTLLSLCLDGPPGCARARTEPQSGARVRGCQWLRAPLRASPLRAGSAAAAGQGKGAGRLPLGCKVPGRLPPGVAAGQDPEQQEHNAGGPEEQSGPHDRRQRVPPARWSPARRAGEGAAGPRPSSWRHGERTSEPRAGTRSRAGGLRTPRGGAGGREGTQHRAGGLRYLKARHKRQRCPPAGGRGAQVRVKDQGPLGAGFRPRPTPLAWVWE